LREEPRTDERAGMRLARRQRATISAATVIVIAASALVVYAIRASGYTARHVDLNDGGVWVTDNADGLYGRLNKPVGQLDAGFVPPGGARTSYTVDVVQEGSAVLAIDRGQGKLFPVDVTAGRPIEAQAATVAGADAIALSGGTAAVLDPATGKVWGARISGGNLSGVAALDSAARPLATVGAQSDPPSLMPAPSLPRRPVRRGSSRSAQRDLDSASRRLPICTGRCPGWP
jgi:large repetitive protein